MASRTDRQGREIVDYKPLMLGDRVLIRPAAAQQRGLIELPETAQTQEGIVVAVGPGLPHPVTGKLVVPDIHVDDRVIYGKYSGHEVEVNGERFWSMRESEVHLILAPLSKSLDN